MTSQSFYVCNCYFTQNFFISKQNLHVTFFERSQFLRDYGEILRGNGSTPGEITEILEQLEKEKERRLNVAEDSWNRKKKIGNEYEKLHPNIYVLNESFFEPEFLSIVKYCLSISSTQDGLITMLKKEKGSKIYSMPVFTKDFCNLFIEELEHFQSSDMPKGKPNTMNHYGISIHELGFDEQFMIPFREKYLQPICAILYPEWGGDVLDSHKVFVVNYERQNKDVALGFHFDNAELTINVSLGKDFEEGSLYFGAMNNETQNEFACTEYKHVIGQGLLHRGHHMHGAMEIEEGERYNLIMWLRSSKIRNQNCPMCENKPQLVEVCGYGDGFTKPEEKTVEVCSMT